MVIIMKVSRQLRMKSKETGLNCLIYLPKMLRDLFSDKVTINNIDFISDLPNCLTKNHNLQFPLILFLHGSGESGSNIDLVARHGIPKFIEITNSQFLQTFNFITISPQCPSNKKWIEIINKIDGIFEEINDIKWIDKKRIYLTGISIGSDATMYYACNFTKDFFLIPRAIAPVCVGVPGDLKKIKNKLKDYKNPIWIHQGYERPNNRCRFKEERVRMHKEIAEKWFDSNKNIYITTHNAPCHKECWKYFYENVFLYEWFLDPISTPQIEEKYNWNLIENKEKLQYEFKGFIKNQK